MTGTESGDNKCCPGDDGGDCETTGPGSGDDGSQIGRRWVQPRADASWP